MNVIKDLIWKFGTLGCISLTCLFIFFLLLLLFVGFSKKKLEEKISLFIDLKFNFKPSNWFQIAIIILSIKNLAQKTDFCQRFGPIAIQKLSIDYSKRG